MTALARRILAIHAAELAVGASLIALFSLCGAFNGWFDILAGFEPIWFILMLAGLAGTLWLAPAGRARTAVVGICGAGALAGLIEMGPDMLGALAAHAKPNGHSVKVLTMNMWVDNPYPEKAIDAVIAARPDIALLQETTDLHPAEQSRLLGGFANLVHCVPAWRCGEMIATRWPVLASGDVGQAPGLERGGFAALWARIQTPDGPVTVVTSHFAWPIPPEPQARQFDKLIASLAPFPKSDLIFSADMNLPPWTFSMRRIERRMAPMTRRTFGVFSWPATLARIYKPSPLPPFLAIDHVFAGPAWRTVSVRRLPRSTSDHYGVMIELTRAPIGTRATSTAAPPAPPHLATPPRR